MILFPRFFTKDLPDLQVPTRKTDATIKDDRGEVVFHLADVEVPEEWSDLAARITAQKYFVRTGVKSNPRGRETSAVTMCLEVATTIADAGHVMGYFDAAAAGCFRDELYFLLVNQYGAFNSPVWFNVRLWHSYGIRGNGVNWWYNPETKQAERVQNAYEHPGPSACFIQSLEDNLCDDGGIADFWSREARVFKQGSGSGTNASKVREQGAPTATDGEASGVISFLKVADYAAGAIKSGGGPRRAAKMVCLDVDHPDISAFVQWKVDEERKAQVLIAAGFSKGMEGEAYTTVSGQNANHSIRLPDAFMEAVEQNGPWELKSRVGGKTVKTVSARGIWNHLCLAAWEVADPGVQFDDTINRWHTTPSAGRIRGSNPCSEYMSLDDSACNLASLRLTKFFVGDVFNAKAFRHAVRTFIIAQDILVDFGSYPTKKIAENTHRYRQLGLGYCDLGALLMLRGLSYASEEGRQFASAVTALLNAHAWATSAELAKELGPFEGFAADREYVLSVLAEHQRHVGPTEQQLNVLATDTYREAYMEAYKYGVRNSQLTLLAPTGTIGFLMDATTTGVEPLLSHVQYKTLAGGGNEVLENKEVAPTLKRLGYRDNEISRIIEGLRTGGALTALVRPEHKAIFLTALGPGETLPPEAHVDMIAAVQPHLSGAVSKTCNLPATATVEDISNLYFRAWRAGVKALAVYRAGSKGAEPVKTSKTSKTSEEEPKGAPKAPVQPYQRKLPPECQGTGWRAVLDRVWKLYIHSGEYPDGTLGEVFVTVGKDGSTVAGLISAWAQAVSIGLQYGVPLAKFVDVFTHGRFEPAGNVSGHASVKRATSLVDLVMRILAVKYLQRTDLAHVHEEEEKPAEDVHGDGPLCPTCHSVTVRNGSCHRCPNCGESLGCS